MVEVVVPGWFCVCFSVRPGVDFKAVVDESVCKDRVEGVLLVIHALWLRIQVLTS